MTGLGESVENVINLGKLIGLLFLFYFEKNPRYELGCPAMRTIFLVTVKVRCHQSSPVLSSQNPTSFHSFQLLE